MDVNGDGLSDIVLGPDANGNWYVMQNTGSEFVDQGAWITGVYANWATATDRTFIMDTNGDGLSDIVLGPDANGNWYVMQSTGTGFVNKGAWLTNTFGSMATLGSLIRTMDTNGDGLLDFVLGPTSVGNWYVIQNTGTSFVYKGALATGVYSSWTSAPDRIRAMETNGDGLSDIVLGPDSTGKWSVLQHSTGLTTKLSTVSNGAGTTDTISYKPLTDTTVHTKGTGAVFPNQDFMGPMYVVSEHKTSDGVGGDYKTTFTYENARVNVQGMGFLGFKKLNATDTRTNIVTKTTYADTKKFVDTTTGAALWPYYGMATSVKKYYNDALLNAQVNTLQYYEYGDGAHFYFPYVSAQTVSVYELPSAGSSLVSTVSTQNTYNSYCAINVQYCDLESVVVTSTDGANTYTRTTNNTYDYSGIDEWMLGRLARSSVTSATPTGSLTRTSMFGYDPLTRLLIAETIEPDDASRTLRTEYGYDGYGNKTSVTVMDSGNQTYPITTAISTSVYDYSQLGTAGTYKVTNTNAMGHVETQVIDARFGVPLSLTGPNQLATSWTYDGFGRKKLETRADGTTTSWSYLWCNKTCSGATIDSIYSLTETSSGSASIKSYFDSHGRQTLSRTWSLTGSEVYSDTEYNNLGQVKRVSRPHFINDTAQWTDFTYDTIGRMTKQARADGGIEETAYNGLTTTLHRTSVNDNYDQTITRVSNVEGNLTQVTDEGYNITRYEYDPFGNVTRVTDPDNNDTDMVYDIRGRKLSMDDPDMGHWEYKYDALGQLRWQMNAKGQTSLLSYDVLGRMINRWETDGTNTWTYDEPGSKGIGKLWKITGLNGYTETYSYDTLGRPSQSTQVISGTSYATTTAYDSFGRVSTLTYPTGFQVKHGYNDRGYLTSVSNAANSAEVYWTAQTTTADGKLTSELFGNGLQTIRSFKADSGRVESIGTYGSGITNNVQALTYSYDALGNLQSRDDAVQSLNETFGYDNFNRLTSANISGVGSKTWVYDAIGNIKQKDGCTDYVYGSTGSKPHAVTTACGSTYAYDANGNLTSGGGRTMVWNGANLPTKITKGTVTTNFGYAPDRSRFSQVASAGGVTTTTQYVGKLYEKSTVGIIKTYRHYIHAGSRVVAIREQVNTGTPTLKYLHPDHLGSTDVITDGAGAVLERQSFDAFGTRRIASTWAPGSTITSQFSTRGFTGHEQLDNVGLIHMNGRVYDAGLGRFISADPIVQAPGNAQSLNRYSYTINNPLALTDPSGYLFGDFGDWFDDNITQPIGDAIGVDKEDFQKYALPVLGIATAVFTYGALSGTSIWGGGYGASFAAGSAGGLVASGGDLNAALIGGFTAMATFGVGELFGHSVPFMSSNHLGKIAAHGVVGGTSTQAMGGSFRSGFMSGGFTAFAAPGIGTLSLGDTGQLMAASITGGTASAIGGGKFANGAMTGAWGYLFNDLARKRRLVNPTGGDIRSDSEGDGHYGASRGNRSHLGVDFSSSYGQSVMSPVDGMAVNFTGSSTGYPMVDITPSDQSLGIDKIRLIYVDAPEGINAWNTYSVSAGQTIGASANLQNLGYSSGVTPHVHTQIMSGGQWVNPTPYFFGSD